MPITQLSDRSLISVAGPDAEHFLQNILTTDLSQLAPGELKPGALLTPQGKIMFDFLISRNGDEAFLLDCRADVANDFQRRLTLYKLRAKAEISKLEQKLVVSRWGDDSTASQTDSTWLADARFPSDAGVERLYADTTTAQPDEAAWADVRIAHGIVESGADYDLGDAFPHDILLDETGGVGFTKGCYVGQEVVSRMQHRGTARRRVMVVHGDAALPDKGTEIRANGRPVGLLASVAGANGLAIVRIDRVKDAMDAGHPITADDIVVSLSIPAWARYTLPQSDSGTENA